MINTTPSEKARARELAKKLGTHIPSEISIVMWPLPLLEALVARIEALEAKVTKGEKL